MGTPNNTGGGEENGVMMKVVTGPGGYILQDVPHLTDYIPDLPVCIFFLPLFLYEIDFSCFHAMLCNYYTQVHAGTGERIFWNMMRMIWLKM